MSPTTQQFTWIDRDTAARDLLQLVYHAPRDISQRALDLLPAIRSPAIVPELLEIVRNDNFWYRNEIALKAISLAVDDIYLPELKQHIPTNKNSFNGDTYLFKATVQLVKRHPRNRDWLTEALDEHFAFVDTLTPKEQHEDLVWFSLMFRDSDELGLPILDHLMSLLEEHPDLLTLRALLELHSCDTRPSTQVWLAERWEAIEGLCITQGGMFSPQWDYYFTVLMECWDELRQRLFTAYPSFVAEYESTMGEINTIRASNHPPMDVLHAPRWQEAEALYKQALAGDKKSRSQLSWGLVMSTNMLEKAVATHFYARILESDPDNNWRLIDLLNEGAMGWRWSDQWLTQNVEDPDLNVLYTPAQFELGDVLRLHPSRRAWEALVNAYFFVGWPHRPYFIDWIAYQTDRLSGLQVEYTGATLAVEERPWFRALVERETGKA